MRHDVSGESPFVTDWRVDETCGGAAGERSDPATLTSWWPSVAREVPAIGSSSYLVIWSSGYLVIWSSDRISHLLAA